MIKISIFSTEAAFGITLPFSFQKIINEGFNFNGILAFYNFLFGRSDSSANIWAYTDLT